MLPSSVAMARVKERKYRGKSDLVFVECGDVRKMDLGGDLKSWALGWIEDKNNK